MNPGGVNPGSVSPGGVNPGGLRMTPIAIAGAGPVGLVLACALAERGAPVKLFEKRAELNRASKASTFHPSTLEILDRLGVLSAVLPLGWRADRIQYRQAKGPVLAEFDLAVLSDETKFPYRLHLEQSEITPGLLARLMTFPNAEVVFDAELTDFVEHAAGVTVTLATPTGVRIEQAGYLVGADGARSRVRDLLEIPFDGEDYPNRVLRLMTKTDLSAFAPGLAPVTYVFDGDASMSLLRMPDVWRIIFRAPPTESDAEAQSLEAIDARLTRFFGVGSEAIELTGTDIYAVAKRMAQRYREGRVLLAGDAAHLTNTRGGMNMNCGIHDAYALAETLSGPCGDLDLDRYAESRRHIAAVEVIPRSDRAVTPGVDWLAEVRAEAADPIRAREFLRRAALLDITPLRSAA